VTVLFLVLPLVSAFLAPIGGLVRKRFGTWLNILIYAAGCTLGVLLVNQPASVVVLGGWEPPFGINLYAGPLGASFGTLIYALALFIHIADLDKGRPAAYNLLFSLFVFSSVGMLLTGDLFNLFIFVEIGSIAVIALGSAASMKAGSRGALKYLVPSGLLSMIMLAGIALIYAALGTLNIAHIAAGGALNGPLALLAGTAVIAMFLFETELFPFNSWVPDLYKGSASTLAAAISGIGGIAGAGALGRVFLTMMGPGSSFQLAWQQLSSVLFWVAAISIVIGELAALKERDLKKVLGFSTVGQLGIVVLALSTGVRGVVFAGLFLLVNHSLVKPMMLMSAGFLIGATGRSRWDDMSGAGRRFPLAVSLFITGGLALMGMPLFAGFWGKMVLLRGLFQTAFGTVPVSAEAGAAGAGTAGAALSSLFGYAGAGVVLFSVIIEGIYLLRIGHSLFESGEETAAQPEQGRMAAGRQAGASRQTASPRYAQLTPERFAPAPPRRSAALALGPGLLLVLGAVILGLVPSLAAPLLQNVAADLMDTAGYISRVLPTLLSGGGL
jgi:formate hydrogenlyase subunit 3/multisubunit Na+/H+ antiporter MnhD subunit